VSVRDPNGKSYRASGRVPFAKYHGLGNDFVLIDERAMAAPMTPSRAREICARHTGVGADGVLLARLDESRSGSPWQMIVFNADGSRPEMCGNGIRCFALWLHDEGLVDDHVVDIETDAGLRRCEIDVRTREVRVAMGGVSFDPAAVPMTSQDNRISVDVVGETLELIGVSVGNPHAVTFVEAPLERAGAARVGAEVSSHPIFPRQTNVEFAHIEDIHHIGLVVYERGCGLTEACGTGAVATVAAAALAHPDGDWQERDVSVALPGGRLTIRVQGVTGRGVEETWMQGPATRVFRGELARRDR